MSYPAMSFGDRFYVNRNGGTGERWVGTWPTGKEVSGLGCEKPLVGAT